MHPGLICCGRGIGGDTSHLPWLRVAIPSATETIDMEGLLARKDVLSKNHRMAALGQLSTLSSAVIACQSA